MSHRRPTFEREIALWNAGRTIVAGVDEAGRGPLAGPVVAAAVVFPAGARPIRGLRDSKQLPPVKRERLAAVVRARAIGETRGLIKFVVDSTSDRILGCHIAGPHAGELIHEPVVAMVVGASYSDLRRAIHVHPTLSEGINSAAGGMHRETGT